VLDDYGVISLTAPKLILPAVAFVAPVESPVIS